MKLQFKNQQYQVDAANAVVNLFNGQNNNENKILIDREVRGIGYFEEEIEVYSYGNNFINIGESVLRQNIKLVQKESGLDMTEESKFSDKNYLKNFSIEMETGTGKTYTYIKTMYELNKAYGFSKFIVMVPSIAIREGTLKSFQVTEEHFKEQYGKKIRYFVYNTGNSSNIANIKLFSEDSNINVIIMNYQAFNTKSEESRKIYEELDELQSRKPIDIIKMTNPILILDEPQKMGKAEERLNEFNPLFILRYSATHKPEKVYNLIYRIDAVDAYNKRLVKKIGVKTCEINNAKNNDAYIYFENIDIGIGEPRAHIEIETKSKNGTRKILKWVKVGDRLFDLSGGLKEYEGYTVSQIDFSSDIVATISFSNGVSIKANELIGSIEDKSLARAQIRQTILSHFEKEKLLYYRNIKVLSLFFIDEVAKYKIYDENNNPVNGEYASLFEEIYKEVYYEYLFKELGIDYEEIKNKDNKELLSRIKINDKTPGYAKYLLSLYEKKVHSGYFSIDKKKSKNVEKGEYYFIDSKVAKSGDQKGETDYSDAFDLIMKDKERLLSFDEPVRFIFSHSALREGWDNPNIFQICTLKKNNSEISKRQEIGRGMRICVNQDGIRQDSEVLDSEFHAVNKLTVIASESYDEFARSLQDEMLKSLSRKSYQIMDDEHFVNKVLISNANKQDKFIFDKHSYRKLHNLFLQTYNYIDADDNITSKLKEDIANDKLIIPREYEKYSESYKNLIKSLYTDIKVEIENENKTSIPEILKPNTNFKKKEFMELWKRINYKTSYEVEFDSAELIKNAVKELDENLKITKSITTITEGDQKDIISYDDIKNKQSFAIKKKNRYTEEESGYSNIKYDLVGEISKEVNLTRKTVATILSKIKKETFDMFKESPEEFIRKVSNLINEMKGTTIVDGLRYSKITEKYDDNEVWTINSMGAKLGENAMPVKHSVFDFLKYDSRTEKRFAEELELDGAVIYAKLPSKFYIDTPLGKYNPDWALCYDNKDYKYIYFVAETKGALGSAHLRPTEKRKIECAKKHFACIFDKDKDIGYEVFDTYEKLMNELLNNKK